ncbi:hypothetical protein GN244_ATG01020 [Phytophthora infestans]|uniref:BZIP domain-containing protein n=1 Tax=Phytophthora infestans TaxID=4787 RepID=A0A833TFR7_PHYIN|nr:hypothetical protein GN244_ATG01020 [Phytophthora infestans]
MRSLGDASISVGDADFDMNLLSEFLFQTDEVPQVLDDNELQISIPLTTSTDGTSSSDDANVSPNSTLLSIGNDKLTDRKTKRRAQVAVSARRHRYRKRHEMLDLKKKVTDLTDQLHYLRSKHKLLQSDGTVVESKEYTMMQRHKRHQAEKLNEQLRCALVMQRRFFASVQRIVLNSPVTNSDLNMSTLLHTFTHLGQTAYARRRDFLAMCTDSKADLAVQILLRETQGINFAGPPSIIARIVPASNEQQQIVTTVAAYAFDCLDLKTIFVSACDAVLGCGTDWPQYTTVSQNGGVVDKPQGNISYAKSDTNYRSSAAAGTQTVGVESRSLVFYRMGHNYGVLVWDFADQHDLQTRDDYQARSH